MAHMVAEPTAFSSSGEDVITRGLSIAPAAGSTNISHPITREELAHIEDLYDVEWVAKEIVKARYQQVALQFPDDLLHISVPIHQSLRRRLSSEIGLYVLADTSYGSCCVDEVAAQHIEADVIVHYGYSCLSRPSRMPVLYVFSKAPLDVDHAAECLLKLACQEAAVSELGTKSPQFILVTDVSYSHMEDELCVALRASPLLLPGSILYYNSVPRQAHPFPSTASNTSHSPPLPYLGVAANPAGSTPDSSSPQSLPTPSSHGRYTLPDAISVSSCVILYIGPESLALTNLLMTHPENTIISYDPTSQSPSAKVESVRTNRLLMRRFSMVQQARDADVIGILVGTLGVASYLPLLSRLRTLLAKHHKKSYTLSVGKLNPAKLANFAEIECFVMVACPQNSVVDAKEFLRPIVTPFELFLSLSPEPSWPGNYILDFEHVVEHQAATNSKDDGNERDADEPVFSLVTGKYRHPKRYDQGDSFSLLPDDDLTVILRNTETAVTRTSESAGADFLKQRTFKGLEQRLGEDGPSVLEQGRSGIARGYQDDHSPPEDVAE
ncbi:diphthamide biosynthesis protein [Gautieria morchelliformis]|nr:diphthamide biosynthesis protein [Gautieria morchelliformis]